MPTTDMPQLTEIRITIDAKRSDDITRHVAEAARRVAGMAFVALRIEAARPPSDGQETYTCQHPVREGVSHRCVICQDRP